MKIKNTTTWHTQFLRRMTSWVCKQVEFPPSKLRAAEFGNRSRGPFNGCAYHTYRIRVVIGPARAFPVAAHLYPGRKSAAFMSPAYADRVEALIGVTAHEIEHLFGYLYRKGSAQRGERATRHQENRVLELFRANREALLAAWEPAPDTVRKPDADAKRRALQERRAAYARAKLAEWERKAADAKRKLAEYKRRVRYYDKALGATSSGN